MRLKKAILLACVAAPLWPQTPPIAQHPRMRVNDSITDTWEPSKTRLAAIQQRVMGGNAAATADFNTLLSETSGVPAINQSSSTDANLNQVMMYALAYLVYRKAGNDAAANSYAANLWTAMKDGYTPVTYVSKIVTNGSIATATVPSTANLVNGLAAVWGASNDALCGTVNITVVDGTHFTYTSSVAPGTTTTPDMLVTQSSSWIGVNDQYNDSGVYLAEWSYFYDWCYPWLVANGHDQFTRDQIKAGYWQETLTRLSSNFATQIRESDFHNYTSWSETSILEAGIALYGDDATGSIILNEGLGYLINGVSGVIPATSGGVIDSFTYNVRVSKDVLTGGAMNWEGPTYWRAGTIRFLRALDAYDTATARAANVFGPGGPYNNAVNAAWYKVYLTEPDGTMANFGDGGQGVPFSGRDNLGISILNDRFPDPHFVTFMNNVGDPWNTGESGQFGLAYKLVYYPYPNPATASYSDLPKSRAFGPDVIVRTGWGTTDTMMTYTSSLHGTYHRHEDGGSFTVFSQQPLVLGQPYTTLTNVYTQYNRRAIGGNTLTIYDPNDCWEDNTNICGLNSYGDKLTNDGGQLYAFRRFKPQFPNAEFQISRAWSGTVYSDPTWGPLYSAIDPVNQPVLGIGNNYEHIRNDLTASYVNAYSGAGDNPTRKVSATNGVIREVVHFQPTMGSLNPIVIFDRVNSTNASFQKGWSIHTNNAPTINGTAVGVGDTTVPNVSTTSFDNGAGRMFVSHLLPASPNVRSVGGTNCAPITIQDASSADPAVYYAPGHGLKAGEPIQIASGVAPTNGQPYVVPLWYMDSYFGFYTVATVIDADHFTLSNTGPVSHAPSVSDGTLIYIGATATVTAGNPTVINFSTAPLGHATSGFALTFTGATGAWTALNGTRTVTVVSATQYTVALDSRGFSGSFNGEIYVPWASSFLRGNGTPAAGTGHFDGTVYYQQDGAPGSRVWQWGNGGWTLLSGANYAPYAGFLAPTIYKHQSCTYSYYVDQAGPAGSGGAHLWETLMDWIAPNQQPNYRIVEMPSVSQTQDYFLNVLEPVTTSTGTAPATNLISGQGVYGAVVADSAGSYVAVFPVSPSAQSSLSYSVAHAGAARHVVAGLTAGGTFLVTQGGSLIASPVTDSSGALTFQETGGGAFQLSYQTLTTTIANPSVACRIAMPCLVTLTSMGGAGNNTWSVTSGNLPAGLTLSGGGVISGTPLLVQTTNFTVMVKDGSGATASQAMSIQVQPVPAGVRPGSVRRAGAVIH